MGVVGGSTWQQGEPNTPPAQPAPSSSSCTTTSTISNGKDAAATNSSSVCVKLAIPKTLSSSLTLFLCLRRWLKLLLRAATLPVKPLVPRLRRIRQSQTPLWGSTCRMEALSSGSSASSSAHPFSRTLGFLGGRFHVGQRILS